MRRMTSAAVLGLALATGLAGTAANAAPQQQPGPTPPSTTPTGQPRQAQSGNDRRGGIVSVSEDTVELGAHENASTPGSPGSPPQPATPTRSCVSTHWTTQTSVLTDSLASALAVGGRIEGRMYTRYCQVGPNRWENQGAYTYTPGGPGEVLAPEDVAQQALAKIIVPAPVPLTSPGAGVPQIVGLATWLWVDPATWQPLSDSATAGGMTITATVTPTRITWDMGEGRGKAPVVCDGPGTPYDPDGPDSQRTDCSYTYQYVPDDLGPGVYRATATMVWEVTYTGGGQSGSLADIVRTATFELEVTERQAVVTYGG
jgi:hypothetical protein